MSRSRLVVLAVSVALALAGCDSAVPPASPTAAPPSSAAPASAGAGTGTQIIQLGDRPFTLHVPSTYEAGKAAPLLVLLHGYTASGQAQEAYLKFAPEADKRGLLYATPDGTVDPRGNRFWNATDACCNLYGATVDDAAYLTDLVKVISTRYTVDTTHRELDDRPEPPLFRQLVQAIVIASTLVLIVWGVSSCAIDKFVPLLPVTSHDQG